MKLRQLEVGNASCYSYIICRTHNLGWVRNSKFKAAVLQYPVAHIRIHHSNSIKFQLMDLSIRIHTQFDIFLCKLDTCLSLLIAALVSGLDLDSTDSFSPCITSLRDNRPSKVCSLQLAAVSAPGFEMK